MHSQSVAFKPFLISNVTTANGFSRDINQPFIGIFSERFVSGSVKPLKRSSIFSCNCDGMYQSSEALRPRLIRQFFFLGISTKFFLWRLLIETLLELSEGYRPPTSSVLLGVPLEPWCLPSFVLLQAVTTSSTFIAGKRISSRGWASYAIKNGFVEKRILTTSRSETWKVICGTLWSLGFLRKTLYSPRIHIFLRNMMLKTFIGI